MPKIFFFLVIFSVLSIPCSANEQNDTILQARKLVKQFRYQLKKIRKTALSEGGTAHALEACHLKAPDVEYNLESKQWTIRRTTLKTRDLDNAPNKWEYSALKKLPLHESEVNKPEDKEYWQIVQDHDGKKVFRYLQGIYIHRPCLKCHGSKLDKQVKKQLDSLYPFDQATGYQSGDLRGAYSLSHILQ